MRIMFNGVFGSALALAMLASAPPASAQTSTTPHKLQRHIFNIPLKNVPKAERKPIPFELVNGTLVFKANVNGQQVWAILDNAMDMSLIDKQFASDQKIAVGPVVGPLLTASGSVERRVALNVPIELPNQVSWTAPVSAVDLRFAAMATGRPISMVLGREYFGNLTFVILPSRKTFEVGPSGGLRLPPNIPFAVIEDDRARVQVDVGGQKLSLLVDIGATGELLLSPTAWTRLGLDKVPQTQGWSANLNGKLFEVMNADVPRVTIGPFVKDNVRASSRQKMFHDADGFVGLGFLANFNFAIDVKGRKLWLLAPVKKPLAASSPAP